MNTEGGGGPGAAVAVAGLKPRSRAEVPGQSTHFPRKSHTMPPICWGAADTEGSGSGVALPPGRGAGRGAEVGGLVLGGGSEEVGPQWRKSFVGDWRGRRKSGVRFEEKRAKRRKLEVMSGRRGGEEGGEERRKEEDWDRKEWVKMAKEKRTRRLN